MTTGGPRAAVKTNGEEPEPRAVSALRAHAALLGRVCMALTGEAALAEQALERVAGEAGRTTFAEDEDIVVRLLAMARAACATQMSKLPVRTSHPAANPTTSPAARGRAALGALKPTEREAIVLHLVGGLDAAGVARACNIDLETARTRLARGLSQLTQENKR